MGTAKDLLRQFLYQAGLFGLWHRLRNRRTLTVLMFHRVLPSGSTAYRHADREFTFTQEGFAKCLDFIARHYNVVRQAQIDCWIERGERLPDRALLITFDDGWKDTLSFAAPELAKRRMPALLFLATEVIDLTARRWWQDALVEISQQAGGTERVEEIAELANSDDLTTGARAQRLAGHYAMLADDQRWRLLGHQVVRDEDRQMLSRNDLKEFPRDFSIAGHGHTHGPLAWIADPAEDLARCRKALTDIGGLDHVMSFPHGSWDKVSASTAANLGFRVCYSSVPTLSKTVGTREKSSTEPIGRIHVPENIWTCHQGQVSDAKLARFLFFRPVSIQ